MFLRRLQVSEVAIEQQVVKVQGIPNFAVFSGGRLVVQQAGVVGHEQMEDWLRSARAVSSS